MKKLLLFSAGLFCVANLFGQVGIGTTSPAAMLDIRSSNQAAPGPTDGLLIPRIDEFPVVDPAASGDGLLVYASGSGSVTKGFYYWNSFSGGWTALSSGVAEWTATGADIERQSGNVYIGDSNATNNDLYISDRIVDWDNAIYYLDPSSTSRLNEIFFDDGTAADPSMRFSQANTGFFSPGPDEVSFTANGTESVLFDSTGRVEFLDTNEANGAAGSGVVEIGGSLRLDGNEIITNTTTTLFLQNGNAGDLRVDTSTLIVDSSENFVGIGQVNPHFTFDVDGPVMLEDTPIPTPVAGHSGIYSNSGELFSMDESGNSTVISPHRFSLIKASDPMAWSFYSRNEHLGRQINVDMFRAVRLLEKLSGERLIIRADLEGNIIDDRSEQASIPELVSKLREENLTLREELSAQRELLRSLQEQVNRLQKGH